MIAETTSDARSQTSSSLHLKIGEINVLVQSERGEFLDELRALYGNSRQSCPTSDRAIRMHVKNSRRSLLGQKRYDIYGDGEEVRRDRRRAEVVPYLEWGINWRVIETWSDYLQVHAATMACHGKGVLFPGTSGVGKSTLTAGLLTRRWQYLCDELALIHPQTLHAHPFPKAVCVKSGSFDVIKKLNLPLIGERHYVKALKGRVAYLSLGDRVNQTHLEPVPIRFVFFPQYTGRGTPRVYPMSRARAAFLLAGQALNRNTFGHEAMAILGDVVRGAKCFGLEAGQIDETCDLIESAVARP